jgi:hypothetical protein
MSARKVVGAKLEVVWLCKKCHTSGTLTFPNNSSVGKRLAAADKQHRTQAPNCELDWNNIIVQTATVMEGFVVSVA